MQSEIFSGIKPMNRNFPLISICILSFNRKEKLFTTLNKIFEEITYPKEFIEVFVVDNGSFDKSADMVSMLFPSVNLIRSSKNIGIEGWNYALKQVRGKYVVMLDDDAYIEGDILERSVKLFEMDKKNGIIALRAVNPQTGIDFLYEYPTGILSYWGCCAILRMEMLLKIGYYDECFFFQAIELDLSIRARNAGYNIVAPKDLFGYHMTSVGGIQSPSKFYYSRRNLIIIACKHFSGYVFIKILVYLVFMTLYFSRNYRFKTWFKAIIDGVYLGFKQKRCVASKKIQSEYANSFAEFISPHQQLEIWGNRDFWISKPEQYPDINTTYQIPSKIGRLLLFFHRLNIDGASLIALRALRSSRFRERFPKLTVISQSDGVLREELEKLGALIKIIPLDMSEKEPFLESVFKDEIIRLISVHEKIWVNTIDFPALLFETLTETDVHGIVLSHESLSQNSAVIEEGLNFSERKQNALHVIAEKSSLLVGFTSTSTVEYAKQRLATNNVIRILTGIEKPDVDFGKNRFIDLKNNNDARLEFLVTGWFCKRKNQRIMKDIFFDLEKRTINNANIYRDWHATFVGTPFENSDYFGFMQECRQYISADRLTFLGQIPHVDFLHLMNQSHVVIIPSLGEALCVTAMEMLFQGGIVIHSDCEGSEDLFQGEYLSQCVYNRYDHQMLLDRLLMVLNRDQIMNLIKIGDAGIIQMENNFTVEKYVEGLLSIFNTTDSSE
nr:glycosyltransferase [uncultured Methanospirillum sp.]